MDERLLLTTTGPVAAGALPTGNHLVDLEAATAGDSPWIEPGVLMPYGLNGSDDLVRQFRGLVVLAASPRMSSPYWDDCD